MSKSRTPRIVRSKRINRPNGSWDIINTYDDGHHEVQGHIRRWRAPPIPPYSALTDWPVDPELIASDCRFYDWDREWERDWQRRKRRDFKIMIIVAIASLSPLIANIIL